MSHTTLMRAVAVAMMAALAAMPAGAKDKGCPPGLAKKAVPCMPPGQVGKSWKRGDRVVGDYVLIPRADWERWNLRDYEDGSIYLHTDNEVLRVMRDTLIVIEAVRIIGDLLD